MKNKVSDVRNHLVAMLEALGDESADSESMERTIKRAQAASGVAAQYTAAVRVELDAIRLMDDTGLLPTSVDTPNAQPRPEPAVLSFDARRRA